MASRFSELRELEKEEARKAREDMRAAEKDTERLFGKDWRTNKRAQQFIDQMRAQQQARSEAAVEKARADMASGKTSSLVGRGRDPYAGVEGPLPMYPTQEAADKSGQSRYLVNETEQYMPDRAYVGRSEAERAEMETSGEYPNVGRYKPTEGKGVEARKAIPVQRAFKAMVQGDPSKDKVFDTKEEAQAYIKSQGGGGAISMVRGEAEMVSRYKEGATAGAKKEAELAKVYAQRTEEAKARQDKIRQAAEDFDTAETPVQKEIAKANLEAARMESQVAQVTRGMSKEQKEKFGEGIKGVYERRAKREEESARKTRKARSESVDRIAETERDESARRAAAQFESILKPLYRASREARIGRDFVTQSDIERRIERYTSGVPTDPKDRIKFFKTDRGRAALESMTEDLLRREQEQAEAAIRRRNPS